MMVRDLQEKKIDSEMILDSAIGYIMERVDLVLVGAEGVLASGGIINKVKFQQPLDSSVRGHSIKKAKWSQDTWSLKMDLQFKNRILPNKFL